MRTDDSLSRKSFRFSEEWKRPGESAPLAPEIDSRLAGGEMRDGRYFVHSLSGNERNHLFMNDAGKAFSDVSGISGLDNIADGRGFALFDYNRDGLQDIALVNANVPLFNLYRNAMRGTGNVVAVRFEGGNHAARAATGMACRDGYGALVTAEIEGGPVLKREHRCGEGFAAQNSATLLIGIGAAEVVSRLTVRWPSGQTYAAENVAAGTLVHARENAEAPFALGSYLQSLPVRQPAKQELPVFTLAAGDSAAAPSSGLRLYTTTATWCEACIRHLPELNAMAPLLRQDGMEIIAIPVDPEDDTGKLQQYISKWKPAYRMLAGLDAQQRAGVTQFLTAQTGAADPPLPSSIVTDAAGRVLLVASGIPDVSQLRRLSNGR